LFPIAFRTITAQQAVSKDAIMSPFSITRKRKNTVNLVFQQGIIEALIKQLMMGCIDAVAFAATIQYTKTESW